MNDSFSIPDRRDVLANLPLEQRERLHQWLREGKNYIQIRDLIAQPPPLPKSASPNPKSAIRTKSSSSRDFSFAHFEPLRILTPLEAGVPDVAMGTGLLN